jgi:type III secretion system HrpB2-like protein
MNPNPSDLIHASQMMQFSNPMEISGGGATTGVRAPDALAQRFEAMMADPNLNVSGVDGNQSMVGDMLTKQEDLFKANEAKMNEMIEAAPSMSESELNVASMQLSHSFAQANFQMQIGTSVASGSNKSLQSLLKNQ